MKRILFLFASLCCLPVYSQITTLGIINPSADTYTDSGNPSVPNGSNTVLKVSKTASSTFRSFLKFNIPTLPPDAVITSAILSLAPSGSENITASNQLFLEMCHIPWMESSLNHASNVSNNVVFSSIQSSSFNTNTNKREFQVRDYVQAIIEGNVPNNGWRIRRNNESVIASTEYFSKDVTLGSLRPQLEIKYYRRAYVSAATIVHASTLNSSDGSISPTVAQGSSGMSYRWYNSAGTLISTSQNLTNVGKGWYGLEYYGSTTGDVNYQAFLVGAKCDNFSLTFNPGPNYIDDAFIYDWVTGSGTTLADYSQTNVGSYNYETSTNWFNTMWYKGKTLMRFKLWIDPQMVIGTAKLKLTGYDHYSSAVPNTSEMLRATSVWSEYGVTYRTPITTTPTDKIVVPAVPTGTSNAFIELKPFFDTWKMNNAENYGMLFQLQTQNASDYFRMMFYSADAASGRPEIELSVSMIDNSCNFTNPSFMALSDKTDAGFATTSGNTLKFFFEEEYSVDAGKKLPLKIYNEDNTAIAGIDFNGAAISGLTLLPAINYTTDKNFVSLSLSGVTLTTGKFYTLELTNTLGEKKYLKFKYTN